MLLTLHACDGETSTDPLECALRYPRPRLPYADVLTTLGATCLWDKKCFTAVVNAGRSWTVLKPGTAYVTISVVG
jgi:hypothetical protein